MKGKIVLKIWKIDIALWEVSNTDIEWKKLEPIIQKKSFLYNIFAKPENARILFSAYLYTLLIDNNYEDLVLYTEVNNFIELTLQVEKDLTIELATLKISEFEKLKGQVWEWKQFKTLEEWILTNILALFNINNDNNNQKAVDLFVQIVLWAEWLKKETEDDRKNFIEYMLPYFDSKTIIQY